MWADEECTERPGVGLSYSPLYVKLHKAFEVDDSWYSKETIDGANQLVVTTPTTEHPDDFYAVVLYGEYASEDMTNPLEADQVVPVFTDDPISIGENFVFEFYE